MPTLSTLESKGDTLMQAYIAAMKLTDLGDFSALAQFIGDYWLNTCEVCGSFSQYWHLRVSQHRRPSFALG